MAKRASRSGISHTAIEDFAEDLGRLLGTARAKAESWIGQRQNVTKQLTQIRDTASDLLTQLTTAAARGARQARRSVRQVAASRGPGRPPGRRRKMSAAARAKISAAQRARWAKLKSGKKS